MGQKTILIKFALNPRNFICISSCVIKSCSHLYWIKGHNWQLQHGTRCTCQNMELLSTLCFTSRALTVTKTCAAEEQGDRLLIIEKHCFHRSCNAWSESSSMRKPAGDTFRPNVPHVSFPSEQNHDIYRVHVSLSPWWFSSDCLNFNLSV